MTINMQNKINISYAEKPLIRRYLLVLFSFVLALMSKPIVVTLPVILILLDYWPLNRFKSQKGNFFIWHPEEKYFKSINNFSLLILIAFYNLHPLINLTLGQ